MFFENNKKVEPEFHFKAPWMRIDCNEDMFYRWRQQSMMYLCLTQRTREFLTWNILYLSPKIKLRLRKLAIESSYGCWGDAAIRALPAGHRRDIDHTSILHQSVKKLSTEVPLFHLKKPCLSSWFKLSNDKELTDDDGNFIKCETLNNVRRRIRYDLFWSVSKNEKYEIIVLLSASKGGEWWVMEMSS